MPQVTSFDKTADMAEVLKALDRDGAAIIRHLMSDEDMDIMEAELTPYFDATPKGKDEFHGTRTQRTGALFARSAKAREIAVNKSVLAACDHLLLPHCERYQLHLSQAIKIGPGETSQTLHKDKWAWSNMFAEVEPQLNCIWAMTDFTRENGATVVVPGSASWPSDRRAEEHEKARAEMPRGSVLLFTGSVLHGGGANQTESPRIGINIDYALGWLRQEENQYLCCPPDMAKDFDPALRRLLGYDMGSYTIGYYTPPLPPGEGPEVVTAEFAVDPAVDTRIGGDAELLAAKTENLFGEKEGEKRLEEMVQ